MADRLRGGAGRLRRAAPPLLLLSLLSCNDPPPDLREWRVSDHDHTDKPNSGQVQVDPNDAGTQAPPGLDDVTIVAWQQNCTRCHGQLGRGDGPQGPMVKATNLTDATWQASVNDQQIARSIKDGKGAMPASNLPDSTIEKLVKLVRMMGKAQQAAETAASAVSAAASASAAPHAPSTAPPKPRPSAAALAPAPKPSAP
ncbi:MAG TPA: cytochrome c [Polyangiaceae bacterium]|nr:cytochrome c [Polyangiaceae bacterium]